MPASLATHDPRPRVLYVTHRVPYPPDKGDRIRNWHVLRALASFADVTLASLADETVAEATLQKLKGETVDLAIEPVAGFRKKLSALKSALLGGSLSEGIFSNARLKQRINEWHGSRRFDAAVVSASSLTHYIIGRDWNHVPRAVDVVDVDSQKWFDFAEQTRGVKGMMFKFEGKRIRKLERDLAAWADPVTLVSPAEATLFNAIVDSPVAISATNGVDLDYYAPAHAAAENAVAFVGAMDYLPNIDAVTWFAKEIWPGIRARHPAAEFRIIGRSPTADVTALAKFPGVFVTGGVPDVRPHLAKAAVVVAPLRLARGLQNKVLEALAAGKAVVAGPPALAALNAMPGRDLLQAESPADWIESVSALLGDAESRQSLGAAGRRFVEQNHDWETCLRPLTERIRSTIAERHAAKVAP